MNIIRARGVGVVLDGVRVVDGVGLELDRGGWLALIGPNGAGKTTMMDVITGKTRPTAGTAFFGQTIDRSTLNEAQIARAGIGRKFQRPTVFENHTVFENLELAMKTGKGIIQLVREKGQVVAFRIGHEPDVVAEGDCALLHEAQIPGRWTSDVEPHAR